MGKMKDVFLRTQFNYDPDAASLESAFRQADDEPCTVQQQFKEEVDINTIIERFGLAGTVPDTLAIPQAGDFTHATDFHSAMNLVTQAQQGFMQLPGELRARFAHDPGRLLDFLADDKNRVEAEALGLVNKPPEKTRDAVAAIDDLAKSLGKAPGGSVEAPK